MTRSSERRGFGPRSRHDGSHCRTCRSQSVYPPSGCLGHCATLFRRVCSGLEWSTDAAARFWYFSIAASLRETQMVGGLRRPRANRQGDSERLRETRTQCESASSPGIVSSKRLAPRWTIKDKFLSVLGSCIISIFFSPTRAVGVDASP